MASPGLTEPSPFRQVDPEVFAALPVELQKELRAAYDQRQRQGEHAPPQQPAGAPGELCRFPGPAVRLGEVSMWLGWRVRGPGAIAQSCSCSIPQTGLGTSTWSRGGCRVPGGFAPGTSYI